MPNNPASHPFLAHRTALVHQQHRLPWKKHRRLGQPLRGHADPFLAATKRRRRHATVSTHHLGTSTLIAAAAATPGLPIPCRHRTPPPSQPPTTTLGLPQRPFQPPPRHLCREHIAILSPRPPLTSSSTPVQKLYYSVKSRAHMNNAENSIFIVAATVDTFFDQRQWTTSASLLAHTALNITPLPAGARNLQHPYNQDHPFYSNRSSGAKGIPTASCATSMPSTVSLLESRSISCQDLLPCFFGPFFVRPLHHLIPYQPWPYQDQPPGCALYFFTER